MSSPGRSGLGLRLPRSLARLVVAGGIGAAAVAIGQILLAQPVDAQPADAQAQAPAHAEPAVSNG